MSEYKAKKPASSTLPGSAEFACWAEGTLGPLTQITGGMVNMLARTGKRSTSYSPGSMFNARIVNCLAGEWLDAAGGTVYKLRRDHWQDRLWVVGNVLNDEDHDGMVFARGAYDSHWVVKRAQAAGDYTCPNCGGPHLEGDGFDPEGTQVSQEIVCNDCSAAFTATYTLTAFVFDAARSDQ